MKRPKNFEKYSPAPLAAAQFRDIADRMERGGGFVRWTVQVHFWNPEWEDETKDKPPMLMTGVTAANKP